MLGSVKTMGDDTLFGPGEARPDPAERSAVRRAVLGGTLAALRARRGWSVNDAASAAGIAPMTWRRLEDGLDVRQRTLTALDGLLSTSFGTVKRALGDDLVMLDLVRGAGVDVEHGESTADTLDALAERFRTGTTRSTTVYPTAAHGSATAPAVDVRTGRGRAAVDLGALDAAARAAAAAVQPAALTLAAQLVDQLTRVQMTASVEEAVQAVLRAMPDMVGNRIEDALPAVDVLAQSDDRNLHRAASDVARLATERQVAEREAGEE